MIRLLVAWTALLFAVCDCDAPAFHGAETLGLGADVEAMRQDLARQGIMIPRRGK
jgi:hypothetical protein